jgi:hypothetical protein
MPNRPLAAGPPRWPRDQDCPFPARWGRVAVGVAATSGTGERLRPDRQVNGPPSQKPIDNRMLAAAD